MSNYNSTLQSNNTDLQTILNTINELPEAVEQVTPEISVGSNGLITAIAGDKSATYQLAFQASKTITPTTASQVAVSSGYYTGGDVTVTGDSNLVADNIKSGVSIFGVNGTYAGSGGGNTDIEEGLIMRTFSSSYFNDKITTIGEYAFAFCRNLTAMDCPAVTTISGNAFYQCNRLTTVNFPEAKAVGKYAFADCKSLTTVSFSAITTLSNNVFEMCDGLKAANFPVVTFIGRGAFSYCTRLTTTSFPMATTISAGAFMLCSSLATASFPAVTTIGDSAFGYCYNLKSLYLMGSSVCKLSNSNAFSSTPIGGYSTYAKTYGSIYVPASLLSSYQTATNWTYFSSRITFIEDFMISTIEPKNILINATTSVSTNILIKDGINMPTISINSDNDMIATVSNVIISGNNISFDIITNETQGMATITINATNDNYSQTMTFNVSVLEKLPSYTVEAVNGASYGFELNDSGYYESQNKGIKSSFAMCKINIDSPISTAIYLDCISYAEQRYDYGILSNLNTTLDLSFTADSMNVFHTFKEANSSSIQTIKYEIPAGQHFIYVKFIKDSSGDKNNDSLQFKARFG